MSLCYYVTGHGYGHAIRTAQVLKALPASLPLIIKSTVPEALFREELQARPFTCFPEEYDCGCVQPDSVTILKRESLGRYAAIAKTNRLRFDGERRFLEEHKVKAVVCDAPSFPLTIAQAAGVPGVAVTNFTWYDIYRDYVETSDDQALVDRIAREYATASLALISDLNTPATTELFPTVERVPLTCRIGKNIRHALDAAFSPGKRLGLLYLGTWGLDIDWNAVETFDDWVFVTYDSLPRPVANVRTVSRDRWVYADMVASVDAMICKVGYGAVTDCIGNSTPMVHLPRRDFAEYAALVAGMDKWGGRVELSETDFIAGRWRAALDSALGVTLNRNVYATNGAAIIADRLMEIVDGEAPT